MTTLTLLQMHRTLCFFEHLPGTCCLCVSSESSVPFHIRVPFIFHGPFFSQLIFQFPLPCCNIFSTWYRTGTCFCSSETS